LTVRCGDKAELESGVARYLQDTGLLAELDKTHRREEVLRWIVQGAVKYVTNGLKRYTPVSVAVETQMYRREQDTLGQFLQSVSVPVSLAASDLMLARVEAASPKQRGSITDADMFQVDTKELWRAYSFWAKDNGHGVMSSTMFGRRITSAQRFWPGDGTGEIQMKALSMVRSNRGYRYRFFAWSEYGRMVGYQAAKLAGMDTLDDNRGRDEDG